jgi:hypothetical protein
VVESTCLESTRSGNRTVGSNPTLSAPDFRAILSCMEKNPPIDQNPALDASKEKKYLYHMVPDDMQGTTLHPLSTLKNTHPDLYATLAEKYKDRPDVMQLVIPTLQCAWNDALHLTAIHPAELKQALIDAGTQPQEMKFFQIDPALLDPSKTTVYLYRDAGDELNASDFDAFHPDKLEQHSVLTEFVRKHYKDSVSKGEKPLLFVGVPHVLHKGSIDISNLPVITV